MKAPLPRQIGAAGPAVQSEGSPSRHPETVYVCLSRTSVSYRAGLSFALDAAAQTLASCGYAVWPTLSRSNEHGCRMFATRDRRRNRLSGRMAILRIAVALAVSACGGSGPPPMTVEDATVAPADLPAGLLSKKCSGSGSIATFLASVETRDPVTYRITKEEWEASKRDGASAEEVVLYSVSAAACDQIYDSPSQQIGAVGIPLVVGVAVKYKDSSRAAKAYDTESIWGVKAIDLRTTDGPSNGNESGLGPRSIDSNAFGSQFYLAIWQNKSFMLFLTAVNVDSVQAKHIALSENARIDKVDSGESNPTGPYVEPSPLVVKGVVGQQIELSDSAVTVSSADLHAPAPVNHTAAAVGDRFVSIALNVLFHRTSRGGASWELKDSSGNSYGEGSYDTSLPDLPTIPGDVERITTLFEVPDAASGLTLTVHVGSDSAVISVE